MNPSDWKKGGAGLVARTVMTVGELALCAGLSMTSPWAIATEARVAQNPPREIIIEPPPIVSSLRALATLLARVPRTPATAFDLRRAQLALNRLLALSVNWPATSPADYRANLARDANALAAVLRAGTARRLVATLQAVADDLEIKLEHCTKSGGKLGGSIVVRVRTLHGSEEIKNWQVLYIPRVLEIAGNVSPDRFPQMSSPTDDSLVPGRYVMWLRDPATNRVSERTTVKVGEGKTQLLLDLSVPADARR